MVYKKRLESLRGGKIYWRRKKVKKRRKHGRKKKTEKCAA